MADIIRFDSLQKDREQKEKWELLERDGFEVMNPDHVKSFQWIMNRIKSGKCEIIFPDSTHNFPSDENSHADEWLKYLKDSENYICALFRNSTCLSNVFYVISLRPKETGMKEKAYIVEPSQSINLTTKAFRANHFEIFSNANVIVNRYKSC